MVNPYTIVPLFVRECIAWAIVTVNLIVWNNPESQMFRLYNSFALPLSNDLPYSCLIISLCLRVKFPSLFTRQVSMVSFQMNELHFYAWLRKRKLSTELWGKTTEQGVCVSVCVSVHGGLRAHWSEFHFLGSAKSVVCMHHCGGMGPRYKRCSWEESWGEGWGVRFQAQAQSCRHLLQKDFTLD